MSLKQLKYLLAYDDSDSEEEKEKEREKVKAEEEEEEEEERKKKKKEAEEAEVKKEPEKFKEAPPEVAAVTATTGKKAAAGRKGGKAKSPKTATAKPTKKPPTPGTRRSSRWGTFVTNLT